MYLYYQKVGGKEKWSPLQVSESANLSQIKPTFISVLALDKLIPKEPPAEFFDGVKYQGPLYFDLDNEEDVNDSIRDARDILEDIKNYGVDTSSIEIYLSGKKGIHILVPAAIFMQKVAPVAYLPLIYKEVIYQFIKPTVDVRVYTAKKGRMLRTCYNIRDNGNYRVPITHEELKTLDGEKYHEYCKEPRPHVTFSAPKYTPRFALVYEEALQKYESKPKKKSKPVSPEILKLHQGLAESIMNGECRPDIGFNQIAMQLALYAREVGMTEDVFLASCAGFINKHESDGSRYNTTGKRERALLETYHYINENPSYEYSVGGLKAVASEQAVEDNPTQGEGAETGVKDINGRYWVVRGEEKQAVSNFTFSGGRVTLMDIETGAPIALSVKFSDKSQATGREEFTIHHHQFTNSSALQNAIAIHGGIFTGTDAQARGILQMIMQGTGADKYGLGSEGLGIVHLTHYKGAEDELKKPLPMWIDTLAIRHPRDTPDTVKNAFSFKGYPDETGDIRTDIMTAPSAREYFSTQENRDKLLECFVRLTNSHTPEVIGPVLGWFVACVWKQLFQKVYGKFPLLHVYGAAGSGKTELIQEMCKFHFYKSDIAEMTPKSSGFGLVRLLGASLSIPIFFDEYKPGEMEQAELKSIRSILRLVYNQKETIRGGGNSRNSSFSALNRVKLTAPMVFVAEAMEDQTAIAERVVLAAIRKVPADLASYRYDQFLQFQELSEVLPILGRALVLHALIPETLDGFEPTFDEMFEKARKDHLIAPGDREKVAEGKMAKEEYTRKALNRSRNVYNNTVAKFGLWKLRGLISALAGADEFNAKLGDKWNEMTEGVYSSSEAVARSTVPEYIKCLSSMSELTMFKEGPRLVQGEHYELLDFGGQVRLVLLWRICFLMYLANRKYVSQPPLYQTENSFLTAMMDSPQYVGAGDVIPNATGPTISLDYHALMAAGMPGWVGKVKNG